MTVMTDKLWQKAALDIQSRESQACERFNAEPLYF